MANGTEKTLDQETKEKESTQPEVDTEEETSPETNQSQDPDPVQRLQQFHSALAQIQSNSDIEGIPEDFEEFSTAFQDPGYRQSFHKFLLDQQARGLVEGIPDRFEQFNSGITGEPDPGQELFNRFTRGMLPEQFQQMDTEVERITDQAFRSTAELDNFDNLEEFKQRQVERARRRFQQSITPERKVTNFGLSQAEEIPQEEIDAKTEEFQKNLRYAEMQYEEAIQARKEKRLTQTEFEQVVENIWWGGDPNTAEEFTRGLARGVISVLPSLVSEFLGEFYSDPFDFRLNGPSQTTLDMRKNFQDLADWFSELGQNEYIRMNNNLQEKSMDDVLEAPALLGPWLGAKVGETAPSMIPGIAAMKVLKPVSIAGQILAATAGSTPIEVGAQLQELRKTSEQRGYQATEGEKALAVGSGMAAAVFEGIADRFIFKYVSDALQNSGLSKSVQDQIKKEVGSTAAKRFYQIAKNSGKQTGTEAFTDTMQQIMANVGAKYGWDPERDLTDGWKESAVISSIAGGGTTLTFGTAGEILNAGKELEASMDGNILEGSGPFKPVSFTIPTDGTAYDQMVSIIEARERITQEKIQAEKENRPTIDHDLALSQLTLLEGKVAKEIQAGREEAIENLITIQDRGPVSTQTQEAEARRARAMGQAQETEEGRTDVAGQPIMTAEEFQAMSPEEREAYQQPIQTDVQTPQGETIRVSQGVAPFVESIAGLGYKIRSADSGLQADSPGSRTETGELSNRGQDTQLVVDIPNNEAQKSDLKIAARQAGFVTRDMNVPQNPGLILELPLARDGSTDQELTEEANRITDRRNPDLKEENFQLWQEQRDRILQEEVLPTHGGVREWTDADVLQRWEALTQNLERQAGQAPDQRTAFQVDTTMPVQEQIPQIQNEIARLQRNRSIAQARGQDVAMFNEPIRELQNMKSAAIEQAGREKAQERRQQIAERGDIQNAIGERVIFGEYEGVLGTDAEGNVTVETDDGTIVEVPVQKDLTTTLNEAGIERAPGPDRFFELTDVESGAFEYTEVDLVTRETSRTIPFTFVSSNTNEAGEVVSVTMRREDGVERTFRDPELVEQVIWQQYFGRGTQPDVPNVQEFIAELNMIESEVDEIEFVLVDDNPLIDRVLDKLDNGELLTEEEQLEAEFWIDERIEMLNDASPEAFYQMWSWLQQFKEDVITNEPREVINEQEEAQPGTEQQPSEEGAGEVSPAPSEQTLKAIAEQKFPSWPEIEVARQEARRVFQRGDSIDPDELLNDGWTVKPRQGDRFFDRDLYRKTLDNGYEMAMYVNQDNTVHTTYVAQVYDAIYEEKPVKFRLNHSVDSDLTLTEINPNFGFYGFGSFTGQKGALDILRDIGAYIPYSENRVTPEIESNPERFPQRDFIEHSLDQLTDAQRADESMIAWLINDVFIPRHKEMVANALQNGVSVPEQALESYPDLLEETLTDPEELKQPEKLQRTRKRVKNMTRDKFLDLLSDNTQLTEEQRTAIVEMVDKRAKIWAQQNGRNESEYYKRRFFGLNRTLPVDPDLAEELTNAYGVDSMRDVENIIRERTEDPDADNYTHKVEGPSSPVVLYNSGRTMKMIDVDPDQDVIVNPATEEIGTIPGEFVVQEREFNEDPNWDFTRPKNVKSSQDIAWMFKDLENMAVEHIFLVGRSRDGQFHNFHLGKGYQTATLIDTDAIVNIVNKFDMDQVWIVHNHPSGQIRPSDADVMLRARVASRLPGDVKMGEGIIINRNSGVYTSFNDNVDSEFVVPSVGFREQVEKEDAEKYTNVKTYSYDRLKLLDPDQMRWITKEGPQLMSPDDVVEWADAQRYNLTDRFSLAILNSAKQVIGLVHLRSQPNQTSPDRAEQSARMLNNEIQSYIGRFGGVSGIVLTNMPDQKFRQHKGFWQDLGNNFKRTGVKIDDVISVAPDTYKGDTFQSMRADGAFMAERETAPYQTDVVMSDGSQYRTGEEGIFELFDGEKDFEQIMRGLGNVFLQDMSVEDRSAIDEFIGVDEGAEWTDQDYKAYQDSFLTYLNEGGGSKISDSVKKVFAKLKQWINDIINYVSQNDATYTITPEVRSAFDNLFTDVVEENRNTEGVGLQGAPIEVMFKADGSEVVPGQFRIVEARELQASHNIDGTVNSLHIISKGQPRDRRGRKYIAQHKEIAQKLNPNSITGNGATAFYGSPTTNSRGEVIQGNGRSIALKIAYSENPQRAVRYKEFLRSHADEFGFTASAIDAMEQPVLVRMLDVNDKEAIRLGNIKNTDEARMDPIEEAKSSVRNMSPEMRKRIANLITNSDAENLRAILDDVGPDIVDLIPDISRTDVMNDQNQMTVEGKNFLTEAFRSLVFDNQTSGDPLRYFMDLPADMVTGIDKSLGILIKYLGTPADLSTTFQKAIEIVWNVRRDSAMNTASDFVNQQDIFSGATEPFTDQEVQLAQSLLDTLNPNSKLMKDFGTKGTQTGVKNLIRRYENEIEQTADLFNPDVTSGNTPEGAERAFEGAFGPTSESTEQESGDQESESASASAPVREYSSVETAFSRGSGISGMQDLDPVGQTDVGFLSEPMSNKKGSDLLKRIQKDTKGEKVGMRSVINFFNDAIGVEMRVGTVNTSKRYPANMSSRSFINRTRSPLDVAAFHEGGHAIHFYLQQSDPTFLNNFEWEQLMDVLEANNISRASAENNKEYFAEWTRAYIMNPEFTNSLPITAEIMEYIERNDPSIHKALMDTARLYRAHSSRGTVAMTRSSSKDVGPEPNTLLKGVKDSFDRFKFTAMGRNWAVDIFERDAVWKAFRENYEDKKKADDAAQKLLDSIRSSEADFRLAHQITNRIPGVVRDALAGTGLKIFSTGDGIQAFPEDLDVLKQYMEISPELEAQLTDPNAKHGNRINLTDYSIDNVLQKIGRDAWMDFEWYVQHKVSLERLIKKQAAFPGITDNTPESVAAKIQDFEMAHPEWKGYFKEMNNYMDKLVLSSFLGGLIDLKEAARILGSYEYYAPLPRQQEDQLNRLYNTGKTRAPSPDPGFRYLTGEGDKPFMPLLKAIEQRTFQAVDAFYQNRAMMAPIYMAEYMNAQEDIPDRAKIGINRLVSRIKLDIKKVATLNPKEMAEVVADYLNAQRAIEEGIVLDPIKPSEINITSAGKGIWRATEPKGINIIAPKVNGETRFYQIGNQFMYDYYARVSDVTGFTKYFDSIAKGTAPWKEILTKNLSFIGRNLPRDVFTNVFLSDLPDYTINNMTKTDFIKSTIPGYQLVTGLMAKMTGKTEGELVDVELLSQTMYDSLALERKLMHNDFIEELKRGIFVDNWKQMSGKEKIFHVGYTAPIWILSKPFHLVFKYTGLSALSTYIEEAPRAGAYMDFKRRGFSDEVAALAHDHTSGNFGESPANRTIHAAYRAGGFVNPATQIFSEMFRRLTHNDSRVRWQQATRLGMISIYTMLAWSISRLMMDDETKEQLEERTDQERRNYMPLFGAYRVPFDYGIVGAVQSFTWLTLDNMANEKDLSSDKVAREVLGRLVDTPVSVDTPSGAVSSVLQMMFGPQMTGAIEGIANYKFYWEEPIVPPFLTQYPAEQQAYVTTPGFYKKLGQLSGYSPLKIQHVVNNATGGLLSKGLEFKDRVMSGEGYTASDLPMGGKLVVREPKGWLSKSPQTISELDQQYLSLKRDLDILLESNTNDPDRIKEIRELDYQVSKLEKFHATATALERMYKDVRALRDQGAWEEARQLERKMTAMAASVLAAMEYKQ